MDVILQEREVAQHGRKGKIIRLEGLIGQHVTA